jgi:hypothetical protein
VRSQPRKSLWVLEKAVLRWDRLVNEEEDAMRVKVVAAALLGVLLTVGVAEAHKLPMGPAKQAIRQTTSSVCAELKGCSNWRVGPCQRKSLHRIDCVSQIKDSEGDVCSWVTIARVPARSFEIQVHHKRILC